MTPWLVLAFFSAVNPWSESVGGVDGDVLKCVLPVCVYPRSSSPLPSFSAFTNFSWWLTGKVKVMNAAGLEWPPLNNTTSNIYITCHISVCIIQHPTVHLSAYFCLSPSFCLPVCLSLSLPVNQFVCLYSDMSVYLYLSTCLYHIYMYPSVYTCCG